MRDKRGLLVLVLLFIPVVFAAPSSYPIFPIVTSPGPCEIMNTTCNTSGLDFFGKVSDQGLYNPDASSNFSNFLCCNNGANWGEGSISFRYSKMMPPMVNGSGHISVNSTMYFYPIYLGYDSCYLKSTSCNFSIGEVCIFKVCNSSACVLNTSNPYAVDNSHIADCVDNTTPFNNSFTKSLCCKFSELCDDGVDNDGDSYIDCADQDCKRTVTLEEPKRCTGSPLDSEGCIISYTNNNGTVTTVFNESCRGQLPNPGNRTYYCSYGANDDPAQSEGYCCPSGMYAKYTAGVGWGCTDTEVCGLGVGFPCDYDFDGARAQWMSSSYVNITIKWCQSKRPYYFIPDPVPYAERMSTGCCLLVKDGEVGYYTDVDNVRIFGHKSYCGDGVINPGETCDGPITNQTCADNLTCGVGWTLTGNLTCSGTCQIDASACECVWISGGGGMPI